MNTVLSHLRDWLHREPVTVFRLCTSARPMPLGASEAERAHWVHPERQTIATLVPPGSGALVECPYCGEVWTEER